MSDDLIERLRAALAEIADQDDTELALDPQWPKRIARAALSPDRQTEGGETP